MKDHGRIDFSKPHECHFQRVLKYKGRCAEIGTGVILFHKPAQVGEFLASHSCTRVHHSNDARTSVNRERSLSRFVIETLLIAPRALMPLHRHRRVPRW